MQAEQRDDGDWNLPAELSKPAQRALAAAGYTRLEQLTDASEADLQQLHGVGPKALEQLRRALAARGLSFATRIPMNAEVTLSLPTLRRGSF